MTENSADCGNFAARLLGEAEKRGILGRRAYIADGMAYTFGDVHEGARRAATGLAKTGVQPGDSVLLIQPDGIGLVCAFLGAAWIGAVPVPVNCELHPTELDRAAGIVRPKVVVAVPGHTVTT